jgi:hypothetical protein
MALPSPPSIVPKKKKKRGSHRSGRRRGRTLPPDPASVTNRYEHLFTREHALTRKTTRGYDLKELAGQLILGLGSALMLGFGVVLGWMTVTGLRRGYFDEGEWMVYANQEPVWFYISTVFLAAMALGCGVLGAQMLQHHWRERGYTAGIAERLLRRRRDRE